MNIRTAFLNTFIDPVRRKHLLGRVIESYVPIAAVVALATWAPTQPLWLVKTLAYAALATFLEYALFEFVLEPLTRLTGHYWERGPRDDERFTIG